MNEICIKNNISEIDTLFKFIEKTLAQFNLPNELLKNNLFLCADEVFANIVRYAYTDSAIHQIRIELTVCICEKKIQMCFEDDGRAFNPLEVVEPNINSPLEDREIGGLGLFIVSSLMDQVHYERIGAKNRLTLIKNSFDQLVCSLNGL